jgi:hypothetical protein
LETQVHGFLFEITKAFEAFVSREFADVFGFGSGHGIYLCEKLLVRITGHEAGAETKLVGSKAHRFACGGFWNAGDFEKHVTRTDDRYPSIDGAFAFTHPSFGGTACDGFVRENPDENFTFPLQGSVDRNTAGFDLAGGKPTAFEGLESVVTEGDSCSGLGITRA